jgi:succinate dehydrogenase hydrophobic anchor subunit
MDKFLKKMLTGVILFWITICVIFFFSIRYTGNYVVSHGGLKNVIESIWYGDNK